jgi:hypothetical protein
VEGGSQVATTIFERLEQDHREMQQMMEQLSKKYDEKMFERFATELTAHAEAEEEVFYKAIVDEEKVHEPVLEGYEEHHVADMILRELKANQHGTERWMAKLKVLKENVEHHIEEEEGEMFSAAREVVETERAKEMVAQFENEKKKHI